MDKTFFDILPAVYRRFLPDFFSQPVPPERRATCQSCVMLSPEGAEEQEPFKRESFLPTTKCCTFRPNIPNYLVGGILSHSGADMAEGQRRILQTIKSKDGVHPRWLKTPKNPAQHIAGKEALRFGRSEVLRCPYYKVAMGGCTIWSYRNGICSTYFCRYEQGEDGHIFWKELQNVLQSYEASLSYFAIQQVAPELLKYFDGNRFQKTLTLEDILNKLPPAQDYVRRWGAWAGKEEAFYRACYQVISELTQDSLQDLLPIPGEPEQLDTDELKKHYKALYTTDLPETLSLHPELICLSIDEETLLVTAYNPLDPITISKQEFARLECVLDASKGPKKWRHLVEGEEALFEEAYIRKLYQMRVLITA